jgi:hypothetical protein
MLLDCVVKIIPGKKGQNFTNFHFCEVKVCKVFESIHLFLLIKIINMKVKAKRFGIKSLVLTLFGQKIEAQLL